MKINRVKAKGLMGLPFEQELGPLVLITGDPMKGKTRIQTAIRLGLEGFDRTLGVRETPRLFTGTECALTLTLSNVGNSDEVVGRIIDRAWKLSGGSWKETAKPGDIGIPPVLLSATEYFEKTAKQRIAMAVNLVDLAEVGLTDNDVKAAIKNIKVAKNTAETEAAVNAIIGDVDNLITVRDDKQQSPQDWLQAVVDKIAARISAANLVKKEMTGVVSGTTQLKAESAPAKPLRKAETVRGERAKVNTARDEKIREKATLTQKRQEAERHNATKAALEEELKDYPDNSAEITALTARIETLKGETAGYVSGTKAAQDKHSAAFLKQGTARADQQRLNEALELLRTVHAKNMAHKSCPFCKANKGGWQEAIVADFKEQERKFLEALTKADAAVEESEALEEKLKEALDTEREKDAAVKEKSDLLAAARETLSELQPANTTRLNLLKQINDFQPMPLPNVADREGELALEIGNMATQIAALDDEMNAISQSAGDATRTEQARQKIATNAAELEVAKAAEAAIKELQAKAVDAAFEKILTLTRAFTDGILPAHVQYNAETQELGMFVETQWVSHLTFSGSQQALMYAGLCVALARMSPMKIVILDEMAKFFGGGIFEKVVQRMAKLVKDKVIDQFIGAGPDMTAYIKAAKVRGLQVIEV